MKTKIYYLVHTTPPLVPILSQTKPVNAIPPYFLNTHFNVILTLTTLLKGINTAGLKGRKYEYGENHN